MSEIIDTAFAVETYFRRKKWRFCFIGGITVIRWGDPRFTQDVDLSLLTGFGDEKKFIKDLITEYTARIEDIEKFALRNRVVLLESSQGVSIDVSLAGLPFEEKMISRSSLYEIDTGKFITTCSAEDLIVLKAFANRYKDWNDIRSVFVRQNKKLDKKLILSELKVLVELKEEPEIMDKIRKFFY